MSGEIKHEWSGSVLTITSDAGTSSADLQGPKGDTGPRGPQGPAGLLLDEHGEVKIDLSKYYTSEEVDAKLENVDLTGYATEEFVKVMVDNSQPNLTEYATKNYVSTEIAKAQLSGGGGTGEVDLSGYATKDDLANISINIDNKTLVYDENGAIKTALGGAEYSTGNELFKTFTSAWYRETTHTGGSSALDWVVGTCATLKANTPYTFVWTDTNGNMETFVRTGETDNSTYKCVKWQMKTADNYYKTVYVLPSAPHTVYVNYDSTIPSLYNSLAIYEGEIGTVVEPINAKFVPVDGTTIVVNNGKLSAVSGGVSFDDYYTKAEIDALLASIETYPSAEEVEY